MVGVGCQLHSERPRHPSYGREREKVVGMFAVCGLV